MLYFAFFFFLIKIRAQFRKALKQVDVVLFRSPKTQQPVQDGCFPFSILDQMDFGLAGFLAICLYFLMVWYGAFMPVLW